MKKLITICIVSICMMLLSACGSSDEKSQAEKGLEEVTLVLDWYPNAIHSFIYAAEEKGYFKDEGIKLNIQYPQNVTDPLTLTAAGKATVGIYYQQDVVRARANENIPVKSIGPIVREPLNHIIVLDKEKDIQSPKDLEGKTIGYAGSDLSEAYVQSMVKADGGDPAKVKMQDVGFDLVPALITNKVDALSGALINHEVPVMEEKGFKTRTFNPADYGVPNYYELLFVSGDQTIKENPELLKAFLRASEKGYAYMTKHPQEALQILMDKQDKENFPLSSNVEKKSLQILMDNMEDKNAAFLSDNADAWQQQIDWMTEQKMITTKPDTDDLFIDLLR
ncbi:ABC transporter substrate-binding protein [Kurthia huakuii]|uniref:ABC transporter substrate-binding protein n=1 Tax=Kurthia huakuii TaxID=1421019 RepID=UPI000496979E|nr:ABC transporter substrate-binding protein [Kurthia huakuii]MBM7698600.1 putative hydroxymethylpyrimidine transport system substrate-binding protein [Kurthia huakuii]